MPCLPTMRHPEVDYPPNNEPLTPVQFEAAKEHQQRKPRSEPPDYENLEHTEGLELACGKVTSFTSTAEPGNEDRINSPLSPHYALSGNSEGLAGIGSGAHAATQALSHSLFRFSLSTEDNAQDVSNQNVTRDNGNDWIRDFELQAAAVSSTNYERAPGPERRNVSVKPRGALQVSNHNTPTLQKAFASGPSRHYCVNVSSLGQQGVSSDSPILHAASSEAGQRPYTEFLGLETPVHLKTPDHLRLSPGSSRDPSEVSDTGNQLALRQKKRAPSAGSDHTESSYGRRKSGRQSSSRGPQYEFQSKIIAAFRRTQSAYGQSQEFLPEGDLYSLINPKSVGQELRSQLRNMHTLTSIDSFTKQICGETEVIHGDRRKIRTYRKIFALLVLVGTTASAPFFLEKDVSDLDLPLQPLPAEVDSDDDHEYESRTKRSSPADCFEQLNWSLMNVRTFQEYQWKMLAPFFAKGKHGGVMHYALQDQHILPFLATNDVEKKAEKKGGFARVIMVRIHEAHHNFHGETRHNTGFAVKQQLHADDHKTFQKEIAVLKKFSGEGRGHKHIISLLATFEQFEKLNLLFYRADGDLFAYWSITESRPMFSYGNVMWVAEQCEGIVDALQKVHKHLTFTKKHEDVADTLKRTKPDVCTPQRSQTTPNKRVKFETETDTSHKSTVPRSLSDSSSDSTVGDKKAPEKQYGRHGDINPGNILWFDDGNNGMDVLRGTLKIADFGQTEFNSLKSRTAPRDVANTLTYRPPECDKLVGNERPFIRQRYDIWCLGCVFLEFVTWLLGGDQLQLYFAEARMTPDFFQNHTLTDTFFQVRRNVDTDCHEITVKPEVLLAIDQLHRDANCSEFCHELLNLIQYDMLIVDSSKRKTCDVVWKILRRMLNRCRIDEVYALAGRPWSNTHLQGFWSQPMIVEIEKEKGTPHGAELESIEIAHVTRSRQKHAKRNEWRNHRIRP